MMERKNERRSGRKNATESSGVDEMKRKKENASAREKNASGKESVNESENGIESAEIGSSRGRRNDPRAGRVLETDRLRVRGIQ